MSSALPHDGAGFAAGDRAAADAPGRWRVPAAAEAAWQPFPVFVVRATGFRYGLLSGLADPCLVAAAECLAAAEAQLSQATGEARVALRARLPELTARRADRTARALLRSLVRRRSLDPGDPVALLLPRLTPQGWNALLAARQDAARRHAEAYAHAVANGRARLRDALRDPAVQEGIAALSPDFLGWSAARILSGRREAAAPDKDERKAVLFLQRLAAKCDTNAAAGTIGYGTLAHWYPEWLGDPHRSRRRGFAAHWAVRELLLAGALDDGIRDRVPVTAPAAALVDAGAVARLVAAVDSRATWHDVWERARFGARVPLADLAARLHRKGVVWSVPPLTISEPDALRAASALPPEAVPRSTGKALEELSGLAARYAAADAPGKRRELTAAEELLRANGVGEVRRGAGAVYTDRTVLYAEHFDGSTSQRLEPTAVRLLAEALDPVLDFAAAAATEALDAVTARHAEAFADAFPGRERVPLSAFLRKMPPAWPVELGEQAVVRELEQLVADRWNGTDQEVVLTAEELSRLAERRLRPDEHTLLASPDVFLMPGPDAAVEVVLGEVHFGLQLFGSLLCFVDETDDAVRAARCWLDQHDPRAGRLLNVSMNERFGKVCHLEVMARSLELSGVAGPGREAVAIDELAVHRDGRLFRESTGERVSLLMGDGDGAAFSPFAPPALRMPQLSVGAYTPRIRVGRLVLQRSTWRVGTEQLLAARGRSAAERHAAAVSWARGSGIPDRFFIKPGSEPKPIHIDLANPYLADVLVHCAGEADLRVTEMLPHPGRLWLGPGSDRICEFRLAMVRRRVAR